MQLYCTELKANELVLGVFKYSLSLFWKACLHLKRLEWEWDSWHSSSTGDENLSPLPWKFIWVCPKNKPQTDPHFSVLEVGLYLGFMPSDCCACSFCSSQKAAPVSRTSGQGADKMDSHRSGFHLAWPGTVGEIWEGGQGLCWKLTR